MWRMSGMAISQSWQMLRRCDSALLAMGMHVGQVQGQTQDTLLWQLGRQDDTIPPVARLWSIGP